MRVPLPASATFLTPQEAAATLRIPLTSVWRLCRTGAIPATKVGRLWRSPSAAIAAIEAHAVEANR
jgi:excisionase family DNA binding protein